MTKYNDEPSLAAKIRELEQRIRTLETASTLQSASVTGGGNLSVRDGGNLNIQDGGDVVIDDAGNLLLNAGMLQIVDKQGQLIAQLGRLDGFAPKEDGSPQVGIYFGRDSGEPAGFCLTNVVGGMQSWGWTARDGNGVVADDAVSGVNLARPYIPITMGLNRYTDWPSCTSSSWETIFIGFAYRQHPQVLCWVGCTTDEPATTGEVRLIQMSEDGSTIGQIDATASVGFVIVSELFQGGMVFGGNTTFHTFAVQARRTAGTGNVRCQLQSLWGVQS